MDFQTLLLVIWPAILQLCPDSPLPGLQLALPASCRLQEAGSNQHYWPIPASSCALDTAVRAFMQSESKSESALLLSGPAWGSWRRRTWICVNLCVGFLFHRGITLGPRLNNLLHITTERDGLRIGALMWLGRCKRRYYLRYYSVIFHCIPLVHVGISQPGVWIRPQIFPIMSYFEIG